MFVALLKVQLHIRFPAVSMPKSVILIALTFILVTACLDMDSRKSMKGLRPSYYVSVASVGKDEAFCYEANRRKQGPPTSECKINFSISMDLVNRLQHKVTA